MKSCSIVLAALVATVFVSPSAVQAAATHDHTAAAMAGAAHGGQLRMAGALHLELVVAKGSKSVRENPVVIYVTDHAGKPIATAGGSGKALLKSAGISADVTLHPDGDNRFRGAAKYASDPAMSVSVSIFLPGLPGLPGPPVEQARFVPLAMH